MGDDIDGFRQLLAGYKSTICIALTDATLRNSDVTAEALEDYRNMIKTTTEDLEAHLQSIDEKLESIFGRTAMQPAADATQVELIKEERISAQRCLQICSQLSDHIDQIQATHNGSNSPPQSTLPEVLFAEGLQECKKSLDTTVTKLESFMKHRIERLVSRSKATGTSEEDLEDLEKLRETWETLRQCMDICYKADIQVKQNVSTIDNYGLGDAVQFMVSTDGKIIHGKNRGLGWRTRQVGGYLSDESVQQISRDMSRTSFQSPEMKDFTPPCNELLAHDNGAETPSRSEFRERYGPGFKLTPKPSTDSSIPSVTSTEDSAGQSRAELRKP